MFILLALLVDLVIGAAAYFVSWALQPKPGKPQPKGLSDFSLPTVDGTRPIPVIFGTVKLTGPNVIWYGDLRVQGFQIQGHDAGFYYYLGMDLALCMGPVDSVDDILFGDLKPPWSYSSTIGDHDRYTFDAPMLFGGNTQSGGVSGNADVYKGAASQSPNDYMQSAADPNYPGLPFLCHVVLRKPYVGTSEFPRPVSFIVTRCPNQLGLTSGRHRIGYVAPEFGYDANPACMLYELLTDTTWGLGISSSVIDAATFVAAGNTLFTENMGLAMIWEQPSPASDLISEILRHIDADLYTDPVTGKLSMSLIRNDYDPATLPVFDETNVDKVEISRGSWSETSNIVRIQYVSRVDNFLERTVQWQNLANFQTRGVRVAADLPFRGFSSARSATVAASRACKLLGFPFAKIKLEASRIAWTLRPGSPFMLNWPRLGINGMVCRLARPASGELTAGAITMDAIEDQFGLGGTGYGVPGASSWIDPQGPPLPLTLQQLVELPYQLAGGAFRKALAIASRSTSGESGYEIWSDPAGGSAYAKSAIVPSFAPSGTLTANYAASTAALDATGFSVNNLKDPDQLLSCTTDEQYHGVNLALIDNEIIAWRTVSGSGSSRTISNVLRGVLDTIPAAHSSGAVVYFFGSATLGIVNPSAPYTTDALISAKLLPYTTRATLDISSAVQMTLQLASRALKPLPPGNLKFNSTTSWPTSEPSGVDLLVSWAHRSRINQASDQVVVAQDNAANYAGGPEGNYTIEIRVGGTLKRTVTGLTGTSWTWTAAMQTTDGATSGSAIDFRLIPVNGSLSGTYQIRTFSLT